MSERGSYVVVEGSDGSGKSTQLELLRRKLDELEVDTVFTREPGGDHQLGIEVRRILLSPSVNMESNLTEIALFTADRCESWTKVIEPALEANKLVISDRNWFSTLAYQAASDPAVEEKIVAVTSALLPPRYVNPDLALVLTLSEEERNRRREAREKGNIADSFESRDSEFFRNVDKIYNRIPRQLGAKAIQAKGSPDQVFSQVWPHVEALLPAV